MAASAGAHKAGSAVAKNGSRPLSDFERQIQENQALEARVGGMGLESRLAQSKVEDDRIRQALRENGLSVNIGLSDTPSQQRQSRQLLDQRMASVRGAVQSAVSTYAANPSRFRADVPGIDTRRLRILAVALPPGGARDTVLRELAKRSA